jgi:hypothetical protein
MRNNTVLKLSTKPKKWSTLNVRLHQLYPSTGALILLFRRFGSTLSDLLQLLSMYPVAVFFIIARYTM